MRAVAGLALLALLFTSRAPAAEPTARELLDAVEKQLATVAESVGPSVACVVVLRSDQYPKPAANDPPGELGGFDPDQFLAANPGKKELVKRLDLSDPREVLNHGCAGGVIIDAAGLVLTPYHVIDGATRIYVHVTGGKGSYADLQSFDVRSDLAVLKLITPPQGLKPIKIGEARVFDGPNGQRPSVFTGKLVALAAHTYVSNFPANTPSVVLGQLTNVRIPPRDDAEPRAQSIYRYGTLLEFASLARGGLSIGSSGAAVLNLDGELIGLVTTAAVVAAPESGPGFALPIDPGFRGIVEVLRRGEEVEYGFLGVIIHPRSEDARRIILGEITPNGPAALAGIQSGDVIVRINDQPARTFADLLHFAGSALAGNRIKLTVSTAGQERDVLVTLAKYKNEVPYLATVRPEPVFGLRVDWNSTLMHGLGPASRGGMRPGVVVREVAPGSPAAGQIRPYSEGGTRWLITKVNGTPTPTPAEFYRAARDQPKVSLTVIDPNDPTGAERIISLP